MPITVSEPAEDLALDQEDIVVLASAYGPEETDVWSEEGVLSDHAAGDIRDIVDHFSERTVPQVWWPEEPGRESLPRE